MNWDNLTYPLHLGLELDSGTFPLLALLLGLAVVVLVLLFGIGDIVGAVREYL